MLPQCYRLDDPEFPEVWVLRFRDQRGRPVREIVGPNRDEAEALLRQRRDEVRRGTYMGPDDVVRAHERRWGQPMSPYLRAFTIAVMFGPQDLASWLFFARMFGYKRHSENSTPRTPVPEIQLPSWLLEPPPLRPPIRLHPRLGDEAQCPDIDEPCCQENLPEETDE